MKIIKWEQLPDNMKNDAVRPYYELLRKKRTSLFIKRAFDIVAAAVLLVLLSPVFLILAVAIKLDSPGPVFYRQQRVTQYGKIFRIHKFRSMVQDADKGAKVTLNNDSRVTRVGEKIRKYRLDEICQLLDILAGNMTFVGTRPESPTYVAQYTPEMTATLLLPAGVTSEASIYYKDEAELLENAEDADRVYVEQVLPGKMYYNLRGLRVFTFWYDIGVMAKTVFAMLGKEYSGEKEEKSSAAERIEQS